MQRQRLKRQLAEDRTGFGCGMRDHKGSRLVQDIGRAARAFSAVRSGFAGTGSPRAEEHTSELQSLMRSSYAVFCMEKNTLMIRIRRHDHNEQICTLPIEHR